MQNRSIREMAVISTASISAVMIAPFIFIRYANNEPVVALLDTIIVLILAAVAAYVYITRRTTVAGSVLAIFAMVAIHAIVYLRGAEYSIWIYPALMATFYLLPLRGAFAFSLIGLITLAIMVFPQLDTIRYVSFVACYALSVLFSLVFMKTIQRHNNKISANQRINNYRNGILELMVQSTPLSEILQAITKSAEKEFDNIKCSISLVEEHSQRLIIGAAQSLPKFYIDAIEGLPIAEGVGSCGTSAFRAERIIVSDVTTDELWKDYRELAKAANIGACWSEPIINSKNKVVGTFSIYHEQKTKPNNKIFSMIELFAQMASIAIEREHATQLIWKQANFDNLTQLPNRHMMLEHLQFALKNCQRNNNKMAVIFLDMDHFKDINDTLGHEFGDLLLIEIAKRIQRKIRQNDTVARLGGDEFVVLLTELTDVHGIERIIQALLHELSQPYLLKEEVVHSSASIGITIFPDDAMDIDTLLRNADQAMYGAKAVGRNNYHYFTDSMRESAVKRMSLINDLRCAISNQELFLVYQPIVCLDTGRIVKAEALIRWQHPERGIVSPLDFIPLAEETGLIIEISNWIFKQVSHDIVKWREQYNPELQISINTSPRQYKINDGNIDTWLNWIIEDGLDPKAIAFEITENLLMQSQAELEGVLKDIREAGIELSIDDFGTGYSSFSYLREFQTNYVKIDKSFVQKMSIGSSDMALCEAIIVMAQKLDIKVIAEGIETKEQQQLLKEIGCEYGQGYLISKPVIAEEFTKTLEASS